MIADEENKRSRRVKKIPPEIMDDVVFQHSHGILLELIERNREIMEQVEEIALEYLIDIDEDDIKNELFCILDDIKIEYIWDNSGGTRDGYVDPNDLAWELFEEELEPFLKEARKFHDLDLPIQRDTCFRGILRGLYRFEKESNSEYKKWVPDAPRDFFDSVREEWEQLCGDRGKVKEYVREEIPEWFKEEKVTK